ncbi:MAG TPA: hypothetical protein VKA60_05795 [Blastocatellia bacterium]|nr:hypothetical protein [Blastocatellia bacterium]
MKRVSLLIRFALPVLALAALVMVSFGPSPLADGGANHQVRNLHFGVSGGNVNDISRRFCCSGTLGSLVQANGTQYILSNNHVLGLAGAAHAGDDISQPGLIDNSCRPATIVADFTVAPSLNNNVDCAIAQLRLGQMDSTGYIEDIGPISSTVKAPAVGLAVAKSGRTTGFTTGSISSTTTTVSIRYPKSCGASGGTLHTFTNQVVINSTTFSAGGDSGSLIVSNDTCHQPVALLFAGSSSSTIGNPIGQVLSQLSTSLGSSVSFVGAPCSLSAAPTTQSRGNGPSDASVDFAIAAMRGREQEIMSRSGVIGIGVGQADDNPLEAAIVVYIDSTAQVKTKLPKTISGVRVKRVYTEPFVAY